MSMAPGFNPGMREKYYIRRCKHFLCKSEKRFLECNEKDP